MRDHRMSPALITDVLDALDRHGYARGDDEQAARDARSQPGLTGPPNQPFPAAEIEAGQ